MMPTPYFLVLSGPVAVEPLDALPAARTVNKIRREHPGPRILALCYYPRDVAGLLAPGLHGNVTGDPRRASRPCSTTIDPPAADDRWKWCAPTRCSSTAIEISKPLVRMTSIPPFQSAGVTLLARCEAVLASLRPHLPGEQMDHEGGPAAPGGHDRRGARDVAGMAAVAACTKPGSRPANCSLLE
jgi:hypothetical protein